MQKYENTGYETKNVRKKKEKKEKKERKIT